MCQPLPNSSQWYFGYILALRHFAVHKPYGTPASAFVFDPFLKSGGSHLQVNPAFNLRLPVGENLVIRKVKITSNIPVQAQGIGVVASDVYRENWTPKSEFQTVDEFLSTDHVRLNGESFSTINVSRDGVSLFHRGFDFIGKDEEFECLVMIEKNYDTKNKIIGSGGIWAHSAHKDIPALLVKVGLLVDTYSNDKFEQLKRGC